MRCTSTSHFGLRERSPGLVPIAMPSDPTDLSIAEAAHEIMELERSAPLDSEFDIVLGETFSDAAIRARFARQQSTASIRLYRMRDVTLDASLMLLLRGRRRITETRYFVTDEEYAATLVKPLPATPLDAREHYIIGCNRAWHDYYHWLIQSVPAIDLAVRYSIHRSPTLILPPLQPWQEETLDLLGIGDLPRLTLQASDTYLLPNAEFSEFLGGHMPSMVSHRAMRTFKRISDKVPWPRGTAEAIYLADSDASRRVMANEAELMALLERQGVRIVPANGQSVSSQIATFRAARLIIGPHSAAMSNIVFCQQGACIYELLPRNYPNPVFNRLAQAADLNYWADMFDGQENGTWRVDVDLVAARLDAIRQKMDAAPRTESAMNFLRRTQVAHPDETEPPAPADEPAVTPNEPPRGLLARLFSRGR